MKQTVVQWLMEQLPTIDKYDPYYQDLFTQAKAMFEEQIQDAYWDGGQDIPIHEKQCQQYYNETFKSE